MSTGKNKKIVFEDTEDRHAQLKIRLQYDGLSQAEFFRSLVTAYLNKDDDVMNYIKSYKLKNKKQSKRNLKFIDKDDKISDELLSQFGIKNDELENIFDIIAEQHPDL
tara:strand:- start:424 stop:747 length:324 start_codon:yes stop_codon:yes gene_type:complete